MTQQNLAGNAWVLLPQGAIDTATSEEFQNRVQRFFEEKTRPDLLVDLSGVRYLSSVGLGALIQILKRSKQANSAFALYDPQLPVRRVLEISKLDFLVVDPSAAPDPFAEYVGRREAAKPPRSSPAPS